MNRNEESLGEDRDSGGAMEPAVDVESIVVGGESTSPDGSIIGDLKELARMTFGTRWSQDESPQHPFDRQRNFPKRRFPQDRNARDRKNDSNEKDHNRWDRRESFGPKEYGNRENYSREHGPFSRNNADHREYRDFIPPFEVRFYQEDKSFNLLLEEMRKNCKTYELFTVAKLILQKPERFVVTLRRRANREGVVAPLYLSLLDDLVFDSEQEVMAYIVQHHVDEFFDVTEETVEAPKGRFTCVHRCGVTKKLLSAPNYHKYKTILRDHFNGEIHRMSFERFIEKIETTKEENDIQSWLQQMSRKVTYTPKIIDEAVNDLQPMDSLEGVKNYLLKYFRDRILREVVTVRIAGIHCESIPSLPINRAIQFFLQRQRRFPLDTANNLRYRFHHAGFGIYRKGGKNGISYVCAVKRRFRGETDVFEANIQDLITFLEPLENITLATIKEDYIAANHLAEKEVFDGLNWLIREGYVVEYENGMLFLNPKLVASKKVEAVNSIKEENREANTQLEIARENSIVRLEIPETAIEKFSDGTLTVTPEMTLAIPENPFELEAYSVKDGEIGAEHADSNTLREKNPESPLQETLPLDPLDD
ncbi:MAG: hypothetical protein LBN94_00105 [Puniceicoccales bacterium]|jgi:hypothetical protein|nr:hypothetical protein [Puniceicoccales bacterium]